VKALMMFLLTLLSCLSGCVAPQKVRNTPWCHTCERQCTQAVLDTGSFATCWRHECALCLNPRDPHPEDPEPKDPQP
jgi:hypothetical protein